MSEVVDISPGNLDSSLWFIQQAFHMMYPAYKLNKQGDNIQPWYISFPILNQSIVPCKVLTVASWPTHRFLRRQVTCSGIYTSLRIFHSLLWSIQLKGFSVVSEADFFLNSLAFSMIQQMLTIWSLVPLPFLSPACTSGSSWFTSYWSLAWRILSVTFPACEMSMIVW